MRKRLFTLLLALVLIVTCVTPITASAARITQEYAVTNLLRWAKFTQADADDVGGWVELAYSVGLVLDTDDFDRDAPCTTAYYNTLRKRANHLFRNKIPVYPIVKIDTQPQSGSVELGVDMILIADASISDGTDTAYQWYSCADANKTAATAIRGATGQTLTVAPKEAGVYYYFCRFSAKTAENVEPLDSDVVCVTVTKVDITVVTQPENLTPDRGSEAVLTVAASASNGTAPSYQWYSCVDENKTNATPIAGATEATFSAPTKDFGAVYYFCRLSAEKAETVDTDVICVDIATALTSFEYTVDADAGTVLLSKYIGTEKTVVVAPFYTVDGTVYKTVLDSTTVFYQNTNITDVKLYEGVSFANNTMANLFHGCLYLVNADLSGVNTTGVIDMSSVFEDCTRLTTIDVTGFDTSLVTTMYCLFYDCKSLKSLTGYED